MEIIYIALFTCLYSPIKNYKNMKIKNMFIKYEN